tara:strand:+ start:224 stop:397 length:174 start_codon:yes stop_codon:yes gene_type:complete
MDEKEFRESQTRHAKLQTGFSTAIAFNLKNCSKAIEQVAASTEQNMALTKELLERAR